MKGILFLSETAISAYHVAIDPCIAMVKECIHMDSNLHVKLSYENVPPPLPTYLCKRVQWKVSFLGRYNKPP